MNEKWLNLEELAKEDVDPIEESIKRNLDSGYDVRLNHAYSLGGSEASSDFYLTIGGIYKPSGGQIRTLGCLTVANYQGTFFPLKTDNSEEIYRVQEVADYIVGPKLTVFMGKEGETFEQGTISIKAVLREIERTTN
ncbi:MAG: hypothetical protein ABH828_01895 [archaeon]